MASSYGNRAHDARAAHRRHGIGASPARYSPAALVMSLPTTFL